MINELIKVNVEGERLTVSARELHELLEVGTPYDKWFPRMCEYGFMENTDYSTFLSDRIDGLPGKPRKDAQLTIDMAKELCMLQRNEKGKIARQYFIQLEKDWNSPEKVMARALLMADSKIRELEGENSRLVTDKAIMQPKADYFDELVDRNLLTNFRETAKQLGVKQTEFVNFLLEKKYVYRDKRGKLMPYADKNDDLFEIKETFNEKTQWSGTQTLITPKGRETFRLLLIKIA